MSRVREAGELPKCYMQTLLPVGGAKRSAGIVFTHGPIFRFFATQGWHANPIKVKFGKKERIAGPFLSAKFHLDRLRGVGLRPQNIKHFEFYKYYYS